jgi:hypothetical protein
MNENEIIFKKLNEGQNLRSILSSGTPEYWDFLNELAKRDAGMLRMQKMWLK